MTHPPDRADPDDVLRKVQQALERLGEERGIAPEKMQQALDLIRGVTGASAGGKQDALEQLFQGLAGSYPTTIYTLDITLEGIEPRIWRRLAVPGDVDLEYLHRIIQVAMGWSNAHLHQFTSARRAKRWSDPRFEIEGARDELDFCLDEVARKKGSKLRYEYDFGDDWVHLISVLDIEPADGHPPPRCLDGARACPPEDVGGTSGYETFLEALADPTHELHEEYSQWKPEGFDPEAFDLDAVNELLRDPDILDSCDEDDSWLF